MEASEMLDVVHFIFEDDSHYVSEESAKSQSAVRKSLYKDMYHREYKYEYKETKKKNTSAPKAYDPADWDILPEDEAVKPFNPREMQPEQKPTMGQETITQFDPFADNPFSGVLDAPAGH
jgi:hypothetical protein